MSSQWVGGNQPAELEKEKGEGEAQSRELNPYEVLVEPEGGAEEVQTEVHPSFINRRSSFFSKLREIIEAVTIEDDEPSNENHSLRALLVVYFRYMQNIPALSLLIVRLPWIIGFLGFGGVLLAASFDALIVLLSALSVIAIVTNGGDRLYGGPYAIISYSLGSEAALTAATMLWFANATSAALSCAVSSEVFAYFLPSRHAAHAYHHKFPFFERAAEKIKGFTGLDVTREVFCSWMFVLLQTILTACGKRCIKLLCWVPWTLFLILIGGLTYGFCSLAAQKKSEERCFYNGEQVCAQHVLPKGEAESFGEHCETSAKTSSSSSGNKTFTLIRFPWSFITVTENFEGNLVDVKKWTSLDCKDEVYDIKSFYSAVWRNLKMGSFFGSALLLLPLFTGSSCGMSIPAALKSPTKSVPRGTLFAIGTSFSVVVSLCLILATNVHRELLLDKFGRGSPRGLPFFLTILDHRFVAVCLIVMSTVAGAQSMHISRALALNVMTSRAIPLPRFLFDSHSKRRIIVSIGVSLLTMLILTMFMPLDVIGMCSSAAMLSALLVINICSGICSSLNFPSWLPTFKLFASPLSFFAAGLCLVPLFGLKPIRIGTVFIFALIVLSAIFHLRTIRMLHGFRYDFFIDVANMLLYSRNTAITKVLEARVKPRCIVFTKFPSKCDNVLLLAKMLSGNRNVVYLSLIRDLCGQGYHDDFGSIEVHSARACMDFIELNGYATLFKYRKISSLHSIASALAACCGLGVFRSNTVIIEYPSRAALAGKPESLLYNYHMHRLCVEHCNLVVVKGDFKLKPLSSENMIDMWWIIDNGDILLFFAKVLKRNEIWRKVKLRLFVVLDSTDDGKVIEKALLDWIVVNSIVLSAIEFIYFEAKVIEEYTCLRVQQIDRRHREPPKNTYFKKFKNLLGLSDGSLAQSAVDGGYRAQSSDETIHEMFDQARASPNDATKQQQCRARQLGKQIMGRSSQADLVLLNMPEPPVQLERFWHYLNYIDKLVDGLERVVLIRGVDIELQHHQSTNDDVMSKDKAS